MNPVREMLVLHRCEQPYLEADLADQAEAILEAGLNEETMLVAPA
jgi:hypothetical protein